MRKFNFTQDIVDALRHDRYHLPHPHVQRKMEVVWLKSRGLIHAEIARLADVSPRSVQRYLDEFAQGGLAQLRRLPWPGKHGALDDHQQSLEDYFLEHPPRSAGEAQHAIAQQTGIHRGLSQVRAFLKKKLAWAGARSGPSRPKPTRTNKRRSSTTSCDRG